MVLSEEEKAAKTAEERGTLARKKAEQARILAEARADREYYSSVRVGAKQDLQELSPKTLLRVRYDVDGQKGRRPVEISGNTSTCSLFQLLQAIEETFKVAPSKQVLRLANEGSYPLEPQEEALPQFNSFRSLDEFPSLESLGIRNGQELFLSVDGVCAASTSVAGQQQPSLVAPSLPAPAVLAQTPALTTSPGPTTDATTLLTEAAAAAAARGGGGGVIHSDENRLKFLWRKIEQQKLSLSKARESRLASEVDRVRRSPETERLGNLLLWTSSEREFYSILKADLDRTVGLEPVKEFIVQRLRDAAGRHVLKEGKQPRRHVLISGAFGAGKRFAAELIGRLFVLLNSRLAASVRVGSRVRLAAWEDKKNRGALFSKNDVGLVLEELPAGALEPFRVQGPSGRAGNYREDELVAEAEVLITISALSDLLDPKTGKLRAADRSCYYLRLVTALTEADAAILDGVLEVGSVVIMACPSDAIDASMNLSAFRRRQPDLLALPTLSATDVARLIALEVEKRGYAGVGEGDVGTPQLVTVLEHIIRQRFDEKLIREKNSHLAQDVLDLAITRKNDRTWADSLDSAERFRLTPTDFGLDVLTAEQRERRLEEVECKVGEMVGWGGLDEAGTPRHFFSTLRRQLSGRDRGGGSRALAAGALHMPKAIWVTANPGVGRETFVQLAALFLRASGAISRDEVIWVEGTELAAASEPMVMLAQRLASADRGCIAVRNVEALAEARDALRALSGALGSVEGGGATLAVLIGTPSGMARVGRIEQVLESRFPTRVHIPDLSAVELVEFIDISAQRLPSGALALEEGLGPRLVEHLNETYGGGAQGKELGERGNLDLARRLLQRAVQNRITRLFTCIQEGENLSGSPESELLTLGDFEVGAPLGEGQEQKAAIDEEVANLIGMEKAKEWFQQVRQKVAFVEQTGTRSDLRVCLNIIITGNPGTGKTTFARLLAKFFYTYGALSKDSFVEKNGLELKAEYMGGTAPRVKAAVQEALGGCLFLDEAYALMDSSSGVGGSGDAFSQEALRTLLTEVENNRTSLMVVLAGYKEKMGRLMRAEEGLARRFPNRLHLDDYTPKELAAICENVARIKHQREFEPNLRERLATHIENFYWRDIAQQNAGLSVNLTEQALDSQIVRIVSKYPQAFAIAVLRTTSGDAPSDSVKLLRQHSAVSIQVVKEEVARFTAADFGIEERPSLGDPELRERVRGEVERLTGMANVKAFFQEMSRTVAFVERGGDPRVLQTSLNLRLTGNPGTGKTTVARLIGRYLYAHGVLPRDTFVERNALALKGQFVGQTAPTVVEAVRDAMGGCLFIDEAYALCDRGGDKFSGEVVRTLLTEVENHRTGLLVVLAGYADKMEWLMDSDPGLRRRFSLMLHLEDYSPDELAEICEHAANDRLKLTFAPGLRKLLAVHIQTMYANEIEQHNGGLAVTLAERAFRRLATRLGDPSSDVVIGGEYARELLPEDFDIPAHLMSSIASKSCLSPTSVAGPAAGLGGAVGISRRGGGRGSADACMGSARPRKRGRAEWQAAMGALAQEILRCVRDADSGDGWVAEDEDMQNVPGPPPSQEERSSAIVRTLAKAKDKKCPREQPVEEVQLPIQEGEKVVEEMSTLSALFELGLCPANFEWFELNISEPLSENCGICNYRLSGGFRCGGGTHYVCLDCIDEYRRRVPRS